MTNETLRDRMMALETWVEGHERLCAERYGSLRGDLKWILRGVIGLLLGVSAWLAIQLWNGAQARISDLERPPQTASKQGFNLEQTTNLR